MKKLIIALFIVFTGCVSPNYGNQNLTTSLIQQNIVNGKTTKQDLLDTLGKPATISITTGNQAIPNNYSKADVKEVWNYYKTSKEGFATMNMLMLAIYIDKNGRVLDYVVTESQN